MATASPSRHQIAQDRLIVLTSTLPRWPGDSTPTFVLDHATLLAPHFKEVTIIAPYHKGANTQDIIAPNIQIRRVRYFWPRSAQNIFYGGDTAERVKKNPVYIAKVLGYCLAVLLVLIRMRPNDKTVINANWILPQGLVAVFTKIFYRQTVVITTVRGSDIYGLPGKFAKRLKRLVLKFSDLVVVNSNQMEKACSDVFRRNYIKQPTGYDASIFYPQARQHRKRGQIMQLLTVGRLSEEKGIKYILDAISILTHMNCKVHLTVAGDGPLADKLKLRAKKKNIDANISFIGWQSSTQLAKLYNKADLFIGASIVTKSGRREAFGNVYCEAMACGLPVIVTNTSGNAEIINNGVNGYIVKSRSPRMIAEVVRLLYEHPDVGRTVGRKSIETIKSFTKESTRDRYIEAIKTAMELHKNVT